MFRLIFLVLGLGTVLADAPVQIAYRIREGVTASSYRTIGNVSFSVLEAQIDTPKNMTLELLDSAIVEPIVWTNVYYRLYTPSTNLTSTELVDRCSPVANKLPGTTPVGLDGEKLCPTIYKCILTTDCTDNLNPGIGYVNFPDLRACICNYTVTVRTDVPTRTGTLGEVQMFHAKADPVNAQDQNTQTVISLVNIQCNSFIERELNCQFPLIFTNYEQQCQEQPIGCYDNTLGYAFGGFWNQNPLYQYNIPRANWTTAHYRGIASVLNYELYTDGNGIFIDPTTSAIWTEYLWLNASSFNISQRTYPAGAGATVSPLIVDIIQGQQYTYTAGSSPPPLTSFYTFDSITAGDFATCVIFYFLSAGDLSFCSMFIWADQESVVFRYPSLALSLPIASTEIVYSVEIVPSFNYTAVEVLGLGGGTCGKFYRPTIGERLTFICLNSYNNTAATGYVQVLYHGLSPIFDLPQTTLAAGIIYYAIDTLAAYVSIAPYTTTDYINLVYGFFFFLQATGGTAYLPTNKPFPQRWNSNFTEWGYGDIYLNYSTATDVLNLREAWDGLTASILENNTYPWNVPLYERVIERGYGRVAINLTNPEHLDFLYDFWATQLAPRQCSEGWHCQTFGLGNCIFSEEGPKQFWYNGDAVPDYDLPGYSFEGGCRCYDSFSEGFYSPQLFCSRCVSGYGPNSLDEYGKILQSGQLYAPTFTSSFPFNMTNPTAAEFEQYIACRFPLGKDPIPASFVDFSFCSGHGVVNWESTTSSVVINVFAVGGYQVTPTCTGLIISDEVYTLENSTAIDALQYTNGTSVFYVINLVPYLDGTVCSLEIIQTGPPFWGTLLCNSERRVIQCTNDNLYTLENNEVVGVHLNSFNTWSLYLSF